MATNSSIKTHDEEKSKKHLKVPADDLQVIAQDDLFDREMEKIKK